MVSTPVSTAPLPSPSGAWLRGEIRRQYPSQAAFARAAAVPSQYVSNWVHGKVALSLEYLPAVARALHMDPRTVAERMGIPLPDRAPPPRSAEDILAELEAHAPVAVPVVQNVVASMGSGAPIEEFLYLPPHYRRGTRNRILAVKAEGECMEPNVHAGDYVIFDKDAPWKAGDIVVAAVDGQVMVKRLMCNGTGYVLRADATGETRTLSDDDHVFGRVIQITRPLF